MDKHIIFAVAGSGKTRKIIESLDESKRTLLLTYTHENLNNLRARILAKFKKWPENIRLETYFSFLYSFCFLPYLKNSMRVNGVNFRDNPRDVNNPHRFASQTNSKYYINASKQLYAGRIALLLEKVKITDKINNRLAKYFEYICIDEIQDFAGHDFNFLMNIFLTDIPFLCVGDFYQHTFDTSNDGQTNINLHADYLRYQKRFLDAGVNIDTTSLLKSWRCSSNVCDFVTQNLGINIDSIRMDKTTVNFIFDDARKSKELFWNGNIVKLFLQESYKYPCESNNWAKSKGLDHYNDVCVVLSKENVAKFRKKQFSEINKKTLNKLYVACTRARGDLYFIPESDIREYKKLNY